jgi:GNAT superfamily N-acetyltransferase
MPGYLVGMIRTEFFTGPGLASQIAPLSALRIAVFREWPYLYDGTMDSEQGFMQGFAATQGAGIAIAFDGHEAVGASTCLPMTAEDDHVKAPFLAAGLDPARFCYFGESVLLARYRGQGIGVKFFALREAHACAMPGVTTATFCAVQRPSLHPLRPANTVPLDNFWRKRGYLPTDLTCNMQWKQVDSSEKVPNTLRFWMKSL